MRKRGISAVVATVLIILITVTTVTILWVIVIPMVTDSLVFSSLEGRVTIVTSGGYTFYDSINEMASVQVKRDMDDGVIGRVKIIFSIAGISLSSSVVAPEPGNSKTYVFDLTGLGVPESVAVAPIFIVGLQEKEGVVTSEVDTIKAGNVGAGDGSVYDIGVDYGVRSCLDLLGLGNTDDGVYEIDPDGIDNGAAPFSVWCDMNTNGGGWTLIGSYVDGSFFYDCSDVGMAHGNTCVSHCGEFSDDGFHCDDAPERAIQDSEMMKLRLKYGSVSAPFGNLGGYMNGDFVSPAYYSLPFGETMFGNDQNEYITYDFSSYVSSSMNDFYASENTAHLELRIPAKNSNLPVSVNNCSTLELAVMMADNDGGVVNYPARRYNYWSAAYAGPGWDSSQNGGCHYDDATSRWSVRRLGGNLNEASTYILWLVR